MNPLLRTDDLGKSLGGHTVFKSVSFELRPGQHLALLGPSGCGKSTLLRLVAGLDAPTQGRVWLKGQLASETGKVVMPPQARSIGMVFQDLALWPSLSALDNVILGLAAVRKPRREKRAQALQTLKACRIETLAHRKPAALSVGQQQRVALARALALRPKLLLLDEPFSGLDPVLKGQLCEEIQRLRSTFEITLVLVTHDPLEARTLSDEALVLEQGEIRERGRWNDLLGNPLSRTLRAFATQIASK